jgi:hypothetical protein
MMTIFHLVTSQCACLASNQIPITNTLLLAAKIEHWIGLANDGQSVACWHVPTDSLSLHFFLPHYFGDAR